MGKETLERVKAVRDAFRGAKDASPTKLRWGKLDPRHPDHTPPPHEIAIDEPSYTVNDATHHPDVKHLNLLNHGPLTVTSKTLQKPDHFGINSFVGSVEDGGKKYFVKQTQGWNEHRREVVVQHVADAMGIGHMVPRTSVHSTPPYSGHLPHTVMVQEHVEGHQYGKGDPHPDREVGVRLSGERGDLARAAIMNYLTGNADRHRNNYRSHPEHGVRLYDHGLTFHYDHSTVPEYLFESPVRDKATGVDLKAFLDGIDHAKVQSIIESAGLDPRPYDVRLQKLLGEIKYWGDTSTVTHGQLANRMRIMT